MESHRNLRLNLAAAQLGDQVTRQPPTSRQPGQQPGVLTGMLRAVQTLPAAVEKLGCKVLFEPLWSGHPRVNLIVWSMHQCALQLSARRRLRHRSSSRRAHYLMLQRCSECRRWRQERRCCTRLHRRRYVDDLRMGPHDSGFVGPQTPPPPSTASSELQAESEETA